MEIEENYIITLNRKEAEELKILLGNLNDADKKKFGLSEEGISLTSEIWGLLPYKEEESNEY